MHGWGGGAAMAEVTDLQFAYFNHLIYYEKEPEGPVERFRYFKTQKEGAMGAYLFVSDVVGALAQLGRCRQCTPGAWLVG